MSDMSSPPSENAWKIRPFAETLVALRFLTRLPVPFIRTLDLPPLAEAMRFFPLAGAIIGAIVSAVLIGANMPAILAELAFVSHPEDEKRLRTPEYREVLARSLLRGLATYLEALDRTQARQLTDSARRPTVAGGR